LRLKALAELFPRWRRVISIFDEQLEIRGPMGLERPRVYPAPRKLQPER
jgi:hypothetical protein